MFPFGYGLGYTSFEIAAKDAMLDRSKVSVAARVTNTGKRPGKEVVQVYVSAPEGKLDKPYQDLAAFSKTSQLAPGTSEQVELSFSLSDLASYDTERTAYILEQGSYLIRVGTNSVDTTVAAVIDLDAEVIVTQARSCCGTPDFADWKKKDKYCSLTEIWRPHGRYACGNPCSGA